MAFITVSEDEKNISNILFLQNDLSELLTQSGCFIQCTNINGRSILSIEIPDYYNDIIKLEIIDKVSEIIVISYKYDYFKSQTNFDGLKSDEREILFTSLISADFEDDKKYVFNKIKSFEDLALDGIFNFRINNLRKKWEEVLTYIPSFFSSSQLKDFISYLIENKNKKVYIDNGKVYDSHYKRLIRCDLIKGVNNLRIIREVLLSNCGIVSLNGEIPKEDEFYLKEYFGDKVIFSEKYFS